MLLADACSAAAPRPHITCLPFTETIWLASCQRCKRSVKFLNTHAAREIYVDDFGRGVGPHADHDAYAERRVTDFVASFVGRFGRVARWPWTIVARLGLDGLKRPRRHLARLLARHPRPIFTPR